MEGKRDAGSDGRTKASFFAGGEELQGFLEVLDGRAHILVLQGAAGVLTVLLSLGEVFWGELNTAWKEGQTKEIAGRKKGQEADWRMKRGDERKKTE